MNDLKKENKFLTFKVGGQFFALPLLEVKEVIPKPEVISMPGTPPQFEGMFNLRGQIIGVFNLQKKMTSQSDLKPSGKQIVIVIEKEDLCAGMIVDEVSKVIHTTSDQISEAPIAVSETASASICGVIQHEKELIQLLDLSSVLKLTKVNKMPKAA